MTNIGGKIVFISPVVDPASGLQKVKVLFDNAEGKIRPGVSGFYMKLAQPDGTTSVNLQDLHPLRDISVKR